MRRRPWRTWRSSLVLKRDVDSAEDVVSLITAIDPQLERLLSSEEDQDKLLPLRGTHAAACPLDSMQLVSTCPSWPSHMRQLTSALLVAGGCTNTDADSQPSDISLDIDVAE
jgi:hypothetical protein